MSDLMIPKTQVYRSKAYLKHVGSLGCLICRRQAIPHHLLRAPGKGMGCRSGDQWAIPLCDDHHKALHASGDETGWLDMYGIDGPERAQRIFSQWSTR